MDRRHLDLIPRKAELVARIRRGHTSATSTSFQTVESHTTGVNKQTVNREQPLNMNPYTRRTHEQNTHLYRRRVVTGL